METYLDCIPCFFKQALQAGRISGADTNTQRIILNQLAKNLPDFSLASSPPEMGKIIYNIVMSVTNQDDPYLKIKEKSNKLALGMYSKLKDKINGSDDRLLAAVELAIAGNIIDYGAKNSLNIDAELKRILDLEHKFIETADREIFNCRKFISLLGEAKQILYLGDNAGEIVFDKVFMEEIKRLDKTKNIIYAVRDKPIINDVTTADAHACGIDEVAEIMSSGSDAPGTVLHLCSDEFMDVFKRADLVISKGQGNFEALSDAKRAICFLFMVKCPVIAQSVSSLICDCRLGDMALLCFDGKNNG